MNEITNSFSYLLNSQSVGCFSRYHTNSTYNNVHMEKHSEYNKALRIITMIPSSAMNNNRKESVRLHYYIWKICIHFYGRRTQSHVDDEELQTLPIRGNNPKTKKRNNFSQNIGVRIVSLPGARCFVTLFYLYGYTLRVHTQTPAETRCYVQSSHNNTVNDSENIILLPKPTEL